MEKEKGGSDSDGERERIECVFRKCDPNRNEILQNNDFQFN